MQARSAVRALFDGFIERFGSTICLDLTGVRFSDPAESERYFVEKVYEGRCLRYMEYVIGYGLGQAARMGAIRGAEDGADEG